MAHDDPNSSSRDGDQPTSDPSTAFQALVSELSEKLDEARSHLDQSGSAFRELVAQTQSDLEATVRRELTAALPEAEAVASDDTGAGSSTLRAAIEQIDGAENQAEVLSRMLEQVSTLSGRATLLLGKSMDPIETQPNLSVWNAVGFGRESFDDVEVAVPPSWRPALLAEASIQLSAEGAAPITDALGGGAANRAALIPFVLRDAAYAVLYVDDLGHELDSDAVQVLCFVASQAMECLAVRTARPAATIRPILDGGEAEDSTEHAEPSADQQDRSQETESQDTGSQDEGPLETDTSDGPSTPSFFASPSLQGVGEIEPAPAVEDDSPTQTDGIPWPQQAAEIDEPAPELLAAEPDAPEIDSAELEVEDRTTAETATPTWIEAEPETPSQGFVVGDPTADGEPSGAPAPAALSDTVDVVDAEPAATPEPGPTMATDSFVSAIDEPVEPAEAPVTPLAPPPPPPPLQPPTPEPAPQAVEPAEALNRDEPGLATEALPQDDTPSGATPFLPTDGAADSTAPPRPAAFDTLADTPPPSVPASPDLSANETVAIPQAEPAPPVSVPPAAAPAPVSPGPTARTPDISADEPAEIEVPKTPPATSPGSSEVRPPQNVDGPGKAFVREASDDEDPRDDEARRLARLLVSELKLYNEDEIGRGKRAGNIYQHLREDIDRSRRIYDERIAEDVRQRHDFLQEELVRGLADGNPDLLGI